MWKKCLIIFRRNRFRLKFHNNWKFTLYINREIVWKIEENLHGVNKSWKLSWSFQQIIQWCGNRMRGEKMLCNWVILFFESSNTAYLILISLCQRALKENFSASLWILTGILNKSSTKEFGISKRAAISSKRVRVW